MWLRLQSFPFRPIVSRHHPYHTSFQQNPSEKIWLTPEYKESNVKFSIFVLVCTCLPFFYLWWYNAFLAVPRSWFQLSSHRGWWTLRYRGDGRRVAKDTAESSCVESLLLTQPSTGLQYKVGPRFGEFFPAVAYHLCLNLPAAFSQPGNGHIVQPCTYARK